MNSEQGTPADAMPKEETGEEEEKPYVVQTDAGPLRLDLSDLLALAKRGIESDFWMRDTGTAGAGAQLLEFARKYPQVTEFPKEVSEQILQGKSPVDAYQSYENESLNARLTQRLQEDRNQKTAPGSARGEACGEENDEMMELFHTVFR